MTTQDVQSLTPGHGCYAFFLNAQGRILGDVNRVLPRGFFPARYRARDPADKLFEHIDRYIIADDVTLEDATGQMAPIAIEGPQAGAILQQLGAPAPAVAYATQVWGNRIVARVNSTGAGGFFIFLPPAKKRSW